MRVEPLDEAALSPDARALLAPIKAITGFIPKGMLVLARRPDLLRASVGYLMAVHSPDLKMGRLHQMMGVVAGMIAGSRYCTGLMALALKLAGESEELIAEIPHFDTSPRFSEAEKAALQYAQASMFSPPAISDSDFEALKAHFSDDQIVELAMVIGYVGFLTRWGAAIAADVDQPAVALAERTGLFAHSIGQP